MAEYWVVYRDIEDTKEDGTPWPRDAFELMAEPKEGDVLVAVREGTVIGEFGKKALVIRWYHRWMGESAIHLVTYTHWELKAFQVKGLVERGLRFAREKGEKEERRETREVRGQGDGPTG